jgi:ATP-dependent RNA helicase DeaD
VISLPFADLGLSDQTLTILSELGFENGTPIQSQAIPTLLQGSDLIGLAQTGSGKTLAFGIPALEFAYDTERKPLALILCPTRELAHQVNNVIKNFATKVDGLYSTVLVGGESMSGQIRDLQRGVQIVVGTPGRVIDHLERGTFKAGSIGFLVLDEADEMLNMGFQEDIEKIMTYIPAERQTALFSATMPKEIRTLCKKYLQEPVTIEIAKNEKTAPKISQYYFQLKSDQKTEALCRLVEFHDLKRSMVFCNTKAMVDTLVNSLQAKGFPAEGLHGDMAQASRTSVMNRFRSGILHLLVATDVAARGIDVDDVEAVFNFDVPQDLDFYVHRIGRTARAGRQGSSFTFVSSRDVRQLRDIERATKDTIQKANVPALTEIQAKRKQRFVEKVKASILEGGLEPFYDMTHQLVFDGFEERDVISALIKMQLSFREGEKDTLEEPNYGERDRDRGGYGDRNGRGRGDRDWKSKGASKGFEKSFRGEEEHNYVRLFVNIGDKARIAPRDIVGAFTGEANIRKHHIGKVDIYEKHTFVEIADSQLEKVMRAMNNNTIKGKKISLEIAR